MSSKKSLIALSAALVLGALGAASTAQAGGNSGEYSGGFVMPGSVDGVNPAYHPGWFPNYTNGSKAYGSANRGNVYTKGGEAYGYVKGGGAVGSTSGNFINGNFIPPGTSPAQVPSHHEEGDYGPEAGKN
ncbi:MAG TPA: hypothetical protein VIY51_02270 [Xanthobacteraceae bacterium]